MRSLYIFLEILCVWALMLSHCVHAKAGDLDVLFSNTTGARSYSVDRSERQKVLDGLLLSYDPRIPPNYEFDYPVKAFVQLHITSIDSISETNMEYSVGMFLRQTWNDTRLQYEKLPRLRSLELDSRLMDRIWVPDLFIANEKRASFHTVTVPNKLMHIYPEGRVQYSVRISATLQCNMDLRKYPLDSQTCYIMMESYAYSTDNLVFDWNPKPVSRDPMLMVAQFDIGTMKTLRCDKIYVGGTDGHTVNYTCIKLQFKLHRSIGYYVTQVYVPSILIVILSWVSFWLDIDSVPARISLGLLTVLTMTTQSAGARASLPKVSYVKAIDVWMAACLIFVFAALIEFAYVNVNSRVEKRRRRESMHLMAKETSLDKIRHENGNDCDALYEPRKKRFFVTSRERARTVDKLSRFFFPVTFVLFNTIYWCVFLLWEPNYAHVS